MKSEKGVAGAAIKRCTLRVHMSNGTAAEPLLFSAILIQTTHKVQGLAVLGIAWLSLQTDKGENKRHRHGECHAFCQLKLY